MKKKLIVAVVLLLSIVTVCFALSTRDRLAANSEGYHWGYYTRITSSAGITTKNAPSYYSDEQKAAWVEGARRGRRDSENKKEYYDPYMAQLMSCYYD